MPEPDHREEGTMDQDLFRTAMRQVAGAVTVVTTRGLNGEPRGVTATAVCSLTVEPPSVIACINRETWVGKFAPEAGNFCVNVLAREQQQVAETFAGRSELAGADRFQVGEWADAETGAPVLDGAIASFDCDLEQAVDFATHVILIGRVRKTVGGDGQSEPLVYVGGSFTTTQSAA
jgi:flavin reductase (NADH)/flavin reductase